MKKVVRSIAVVALMFAAATGLAKEPKLSLAPNSEKSLNFEMDTTSEQTIVSIIDTNGEIIYTEKIATGNIYSKKFNLQNLPEGNYFLEVESSMKETIFGFTVNDSKIMIREKKENVKPIFRQKDGRVFLNLLNLQKDAVKIAVMDSEGRSIFQETITDEMLIEKTFNFKNAFEDSYTILVKSKDDIYFEYVTVE
ncbi:hypothetical protein FEE95_15325 [Maribacter algarum]|uniref:Secretion system C-terminal sorting domain-containing protein n=1 Tax=Maribacter algarum (ex Zhang et al. 2020) TaxID=2578118 RepID=A0A5S3PNF7_9FLAO|nr:T9SS type A sorting domain-containing protein [Maribacter algarum]TMM56012.1 hypothetical protein FEE95_15325 [Maribacter algarum]